MTTLQKVHNFFNGDDGDAESWYSTNNARLGGISPIAMLNAGNYRNLREYVDQRIQENAEL